MNRPPQVEIGVVVGLTIVAAVWAAFIVWAFYQAATVLGVTL